MKYKIGEVGHILGISPDLLRHYEKKGIVHPLKDSTNDYRYYEPWDINFLMDCIWYKSFHFSLDQVAHLITDSTAQEVAEQLDQKVEQLREQIRRNELLVRRAREHRADLARLEGQVGQCVLRDSPEILRYFNRRGDLYDTSQEMQGISQAWLEYMPFTHRCFEMSVSAISREDSRGAHVNWGFSLTPDYVRELGVKVQPPLTWVESQPCIYTVFTSAGKDRFSPRKLQYVLQYAADRHLTATGEVRGNLLASVQYNGRLTGFFEAWIPYEPAPV
ncbi:MAG: MerR family transcriptional regulator [Oscillospiraceae bacterium]|nr:MerR family transcriptional regulator [Oscillospiraceae bacterium]